MADNNATILIPDISGFTEFMNTTELSHGSYAINVLIEAIVNAVGEAYEVSEIEGDAVLLIRKGPPPSQKQIVDLCLKIFNAFHFQRTWMQQHAVCPCQACLAISHLTLKFVVHHGPVAEIKVGRFVKQSGPEMIVAHRLLKNSIGNNEYLLMSEKLLQQLTDSSETVDVEWTCSSEEYASIGKVDYRFTLLNEARKKVPEPPAPQPYRTDQTPYFEVPIAADFREAYMVVMNIPNRSGWVPGLQKVEQHNSLVYIGSIHHCTFNDYQAVVSPLRMTLSDEGITYAESCRIEEMNLSLVHESVFNKTGEKHCLFATRLMNAGEAPLPEAVHAALREQMQRMAEKLKAYFERMPAS